MEIGPNIWQPLWILGLAVTTVTAICLVKVKASPATLWVWVGFLAILTLFFMMADQFSVSANVTLYGKFGFWP